jgi:hypothetical protein
VTKMMPRTPHSLRTRGGLYSIMINQAVDAFPFLHAYGVGMGVFKDYELTKRNELFIYSRFLLRNCLDLEIESAYQSMALFSRKCLNHRLFYVSTEYISDIYPYFFEMRKHRTVMPKHVPIGAFIVAGLLRGSRVLVSEATKPHALIGVYKSDFNAHIKFLHKWYDLPMPDLDQIQMKGKITIRHRIAECSYAIENGEHYGDIRE